MSLAPSRRFAKAVSGAAVVRGALPRAAATKRTRRVSRFNSVALTLLAALLVPTVEAIPTSCGAPITGITFSETFPGNAIDTNKWDVFGAGAGGTITVTPGTAVFTVAGDVLAMQTKNNPIPPSGDFSMYCKGKIYASNVSHGSICATQFSAIPTYPGYSSGTMWQVGARYGNMFEYMVASIGPPAPLLFADNIPQDINSTHE